MFVDSRFLYIFFDANIPDSSNVTIKVFVNLEDKWNLVWFINLAIIDSFSLRLSDGRMYFHLTCCSIVLRCCFQGVSSVIERVTFFPCSFYSRWNWNNAIAFARAMFGGTRPARRYAGVSIGWATCKSHPVRYFNKALRAIALIQILKQPIFCGWLAR